MIADTLQNVDSLGSCFIEVLEEKDLRRPEVFAGLYRQFYDDIFKYCVHRLFDKNTAEEITAEVFFKAVENIDDFRGTPVQFRNWLYKIATNSINSYIRQKHRRITLENNVLQIEESKNGDCKKVEQINDDQLKLLQKAVLELKPKYQTIITLRFFENLKLTEIAEILSSRPGTVRAQLSRALVKLRKKLGSAWQEV
jgi:RNA polymerase sigma-70 factor (ECF subfamily)